ncbi:uncharacterized protein TNCV_2528721 [Trichonephila clavipes]|nr:uncharacterized protein TNCV_2528721 [Trichonephila clavipes]
MNEKASPADKGCWVYLLEPHPDAVRLYPGCTPVEACQGEVVFTPMDPSHLCPGKGLVLPTTITIDQIASHTCFFILSFPNGEMSKKSPFAIQKALQGIGELNSVKKLRSGDLLVETKSAAQSMSYLTAKTFLDFLLQVAPHRSLNTSRVVISELDLLSTSESDILEGFLDQGVILTDENIKKIKCPPLKFIQTASSILKPNISASIPAVSTSSFFTQARLLPSTIPESQPLIPTFNKSDPYT